MPESMNVKTGFGIFLVLFGVAWIWINLKHQDRGRWRLYSTPRNFFTGVFLIVLGLALSLNIIVLG